MKTHDFKFMYGTNCLVLGVDARCVEQHQHKLRGVCETGYAATTGGDATAARARARRRGGCRCEQRSDRYYRFTLEGEAAPPPHAAD